VGSCHTLPRAPHGGIILADDGELVACTPYEWMEKDSIVPFLLSKRDGFTFPNLKETKCFRRERYQGTEISMKLQE
jgi:hypothetical protein